MKINNLLVFLIHVFNLVRLTSFAIIKKENIHMQKTIKCEHFFWTNIVKGLQLTKNDCTHFVIIVVCNNLHLQLW
jgi:hypothetical protein